MAGTGEYGHEADDRRPSERAQAHGYDYCILLENIAWQFSSSDFTTEKLAQKVVQGWKESNEHRRNLLDSDVTEIGVAVARGEPDGKYFAVQMFGRPQSKRLLFQVANRGEGEVRYRLREGDQEEMFTLPPRYTRTHRRCRTPQLDFLWDQQHPPITPRDGRQYRVTGGRASEFKVRTAPIAAED